MDTESAFAEITDDITNGRKDQAVQKVMDLVSTDTSAFTLIKSISFLKVMNESNRIDEVIDILLSSLPDDQESRVQIAGALNGLEMPRIAYGILKEMPVSDAILRLSSVCLFDMEEYESALEKLNQIDSMNINDRILLCSTLSSLGEHTDAVCDAEKLLSEFPDVYDVRASYIGTLMLAGKNKDVVKYARAALKEKTADANALAAYAMRISGNIKAAAGYASRAIQMDNSNIPAMETLGLCLAEKGEIDKAKIIAGAINELSPGNKAAVNIISYCNAFLK